MSEKHNISIAATKLQRLARKRSARWWRHNGGSGDYEAYIAGFIDGYLEAVTPEVTVSLTSDGLPLADDTDD